MAFPELDLSGLRVVDTGFGSTVMETGAGVIVRVGRTPAAARGHAVEAACLPGLARILPVEVPVPVYFRPPGGPLRFGAIGYARLPGEQCRPDSATPATLKTSAPSSPSCTARTPAPSRPCRAQATSGRGG
jgi:hypothetical protein